MTEANSGMTKRLAVVFPGQGSQSVGMMDELDKAFKSVRTTFDEASEALGFDLWSVTQDENCLNKTQYTQPALLTSSIAIWQIIEPILSAQSIKPMYLAGHSLGEYSALVAAGVLNLKDAVKLVHERGKFMTEAVQSIDTQMAAILGLDDEQVVVYVKKLAQPQAQLMLLILTAQGRWSSQAQRWACQVFCQQ